LPESLRIVDYFLNFSKSSSGNIMGTSQTSSATDVVLKVQKGLQGMNPEKELANPPGSISGKKEISCACRNTHQPNSNRKNTKK